MNIKNTIFFYLLLLLGISCKSPKSGTSTGDNFQGEVFAPSITDIYIPIKIKEELLNAKINAQVKGLLYADTSFSGDNLMLKVWKAQPISLKLLNNTIEYTLPLRLWVNTGITKWGITIAQDAEFSLALKYKSTFSIKPNWQLETHTESSGYDWINSPYIDIKGVKLPVKTVADIIINKSQKQISALIDEQVHNTFDLRKLMQNAWTQFSKPILLSADYNIWLKISPQQVSLSPINTQNGQLSTVAGISTYADILFDPDSTVKNAPAAALPAFKWETVEQKGFKINAGISYPYSTALKVLSPYLLNKSFTQGKRTVKVEGVALSAEGPKLLLNLRLSGAYNGSIVIKALPYVNKENQTIQVREPEYSLQTKSILQKKRSLAI